MNINVMHHLYEEEERERRAQVKIERQLLRSRLEPNNLPDREFRQLFRLSKDLYQTLVEQLTPHMEQARRNTRLSIETRILAALRFFATGSYQRGIGEERNIAVAQQTMSKVIYEVANALEAIADHWIQFPIDVDSKQQIQLGFLEKFGFPGVLGAIDGTHVAILQPLQDEHIYFNRKRFHSKNVQIICDSNLVILNVNANFGGAAHDAFIWRNSMVYRHLEQDYRNNNHRSWLLGDSGYPLQPWLLIPIKNTVDGTPERRYDDAQKSARNCVERCIGLLKGRFRCLLKERVLRYDPHKVGIIINACCVLHNICVKGGIPFEEEVEDGEVLAEPLNMNDYYPNNILHEGQRQRQNLINLYF